MKRLLIYGVFTCSFNWLWSQSCDARLDDSRIQYVNGDFDQVIETLSSCAGTFSRQQDDLEAYELLINCYILINDTGNADSLINVLLKAYPLHRLKETALSSYRQLFNSYNIERKFGLSAWAGTNLPDFEIFQYRSYGGIVEETTGYESYYGFTGGCSFDYFLLDQLTIGSGLLFQSSSYSQNETIMGFQRLDVSERINYLKIPLTVGLSFILNSWEVGLKGGMSFHWIYSDKADLELYGIAQEFSNPLTGLTRKTLDYPLSFQRQKITPNYLAGLTIGKNIGLFQIVLQGSYEYGLKNLVRIENRYSDEELLSVYSYVPDDFKMNNFQLTMGITRFFVYPKKVAK
jgi:hypothetical protein